MTSYSQVSKDEIISMLDYIDATERDIWLKTGMAIHHNTGEEGYSIWNKWSKQADNYNERDALAAWRSFHANKGITIGTLIKYGSLREARN